MIRVYFSINEPFLTLVSMASNQADPFGTTIGKKPKITAILSELGTVLFQMGHWRTEANATRATQ